MRRTIPSSSRVICSFQSTHPVRGATRWCRRDDGVLNISIHAPRAGCDARGRLFREVEEISIHAPRAGRDKRQRQHRKARGHISIHAPRVGRDQSHLCRCLLLLAFQSTRPVWGATLLGWRPLAAFLISIHAPRVGRDGHAARVRKLRDISIHAPRVGRDGKSSVKTIDTANFNPRAPCGARPERHTCRLRSWNFNPRAPCGARQRRPCVDHAPESISIHAPRVGRDIQAGLCCPRPLHFNPRAPCGARPLIAACLIAVTGFQSTRPVWGATRWYLHC